MKKRYTRLLMILFLLPLSYMAQAQYNEVLKASQFGGVSNVNYNPAIADNRFKFDMNLVSVGFGMENNYVGIDPKTFTKHALFDDKNFQSNHMNERLNGKNKNAYLGMQVQGPLSFMFSWGKNRSNKNAIAVSWNINSIANLNNAGETLARSAYYGFGNKADSITHFIGKGLNNKNLSINTLAWMDVGATYSRVVYDKGPHMVKAGLTGKFIVGIIGATVASNNIDYKFENFDSLTISKSDIRASHGDNLSSIYRDGKAHLTYDDFKTFFTAPSFAVDLGVVYEWRPKKDKFNYEMDCKTWAKRERNRYTLAAGFSIIDIGQVKFSKPTNSYAFFADVQHFDIKHSGIKDVATFDSVIAANPSAFTRKESNGKFAMWLPTRFNMFLDWEIWKGFGLNLNGTISPNMAKNLNMVHYPSSIMLTPRYDYKWAGVYIPLSYNSYGNFNVGAGLRLGPVFITSSNIITMFANKFSYGANIQAGVKIPIPNGLHKDRDKDGVSNKYDLCKKEKGTCETKGCPDKDGDGITDKEDKCPDVAGPKETQGCPDRDKDGIIDMNDSCPDVPGLAQFAGCPDTDGDGIIDKYDECPTEKGPKELNGCPDRDNDGVADKNDACPDVPGEKAHAGCPDSDKDGLYDNEDKCPREFGPKENGGCPWPDTDGDGVLDKDDDCPKVFGAKDNRGCPKLEKKELETVRYAFQNLEFETAKDIIRTKSYASLNGLAKLLVDKPNYGLKIEGHTDNVGAAEMNLDLSRRRAESVKKYLVSKGVAADKLETAGYGMTKPIADNKTPAGRQKNRRVEMTITFK
ncbi:MAG: DUF5723 family protein [Chitinophagales bacterium]